MLGDSCITPNNKIISKFWKESNLLLSLDEIIKDSNETTKSEIKRPRLFSVKNNIKPARWNNHTKHHENWIKPESKYQRMREIDNITGFVVNVHDATNFDIDLEMSPEFHERYNNVISNQYTYQDLGNDFLENPDLSRTIRNTPRVGTTYRCRLRGVGINQLPQNLHIWKNNQMCVEVKQLIDRTDGWITCTLSDIDVYERLLVDVIINTCNKTINLREYLLNRMEQEKTPIFSSYTSKRDRTNTLK